MNYDVDMPPYIQQMADWLDAEANVHPCNSEGRLRASGETVVKFIADTHFAPGSS
ncbi:MAG: hypothetical protein KIT09_29155 [Bryobacteraceae bacterium]|nr:hypothetical protein [Bryobacteraceae bacterium]